MTSALEINGKKLLPIKTVAQQVSYSRDYITRLAREGKINAVNVSRQWFVDLDSLNSYAESSHIESEIRKKQLSEERKLEQLDTYIAKKKKNIKAKRASYLNTRAAVAACAILTLGLSGGWATHIFLSPEYNSSPFVANTFESSGNQVGLLPARVDTETNKKVELLSENPEPLLQSTRVVRPISDDVNMGVLLLPYGDVSASPTEMFSDEVEVLTSENGEQMIVKLDKNGLPTGNLIPFVSVPVNHPDI